MRRAGTEVDLIARPRRGDESAVLALFVALLPVPLQERTLIGKSSMSQKCNTDMPD